MAIRSSVNAPPRSCDRTSAGAHEFIQVSHSRGGPCRTGWNWDSTPEQSAVLGQVPDLLFEPFQDARLGHVHAINRYPQLLSGLGGRSFVEPHQLEGTPGLLLKVGAAPSQGRGEQVCVELFLPGCLFRARRGAVESVLSIAAAVAVNRAGVLFEEAIDFITRHGPQPAAKATDFGLVVEAADRLTDLRKNLLGDVFRILVAQAPTSAMAVDEPAINVDEGLPRLGIARFADPQQ